MKKYLTFLALLIGSFTSLGNDLKQKIDCISTPSVVQICCKRTQVNRSTGESVTVRACVESTGDAVIDKGKACARANELAKKAINELTATP